MVQKNSKNRPVCTHDTVVMFERFGVPPTKRKVEKVIKEAKKNNTMAFSSGVSKYRGVSWAKDKKRWEAYAGGQRIGRFKVEKEAAIAYDKVAKAKWGDSAMLNRNVFGDL